MRVQTAFEKIAAVTNGQAFAGSFIGLRLFMGLGLVYMTMNSGTPMLWNSVDSVLNLAFGLSLLLGLLVRPLAVGMLAYIVFNSVMAFQDGSPGTGLYYMPFVFLLGMYVSGGAGHVWGLDGIVFRNLRTSNKITKFLFG